MSALIITLAGKQTISDLIAVTSLTPLPGATIAVVKPRGAPIRWSVGEDPSAVAGNLLHPGDSRQFEGDINLIRCIETTPSASLEITYYY